VPTPHLLVGSAIVVASSLLHPVTRDLALPSPGGLGGGAGVVPPSGLRRGLSIRGEQAAEVAESSGLALLSPMLVEHRFREGLRSPLNSLSDRCLNISVQKTERCPEWGKKSNSHPRGRASAAVSVSGPWSGHSATGEMRRFPPFGSSRPELQGFDQKAVVPAYALGD
jgi:hypothetical protein